MTDYQIWLSDPFGNRVADVSGNRIAKLTYALGTNAVGSVTITIPRGSLPDAYLIEDARFEIMRRPVGGEMQREGETVWLLQAPTKGVSAAGGRYRTLVAYTAATLLERRVITALAGAAGSLKTGAADDLMKAYVAENLGSSAAGDRTWSGYIDVAASVSGAASVTKEGSQKNLFSLLQDLAQSARTADSTRPLYFDLVWTGSRFEFRTYVGQRGTNRSIVGTPGSLTISTDRGTLGASEVTTDYRSSATAVYGLGPGQGPSRKVQVAVDATRLVTSPFGRREATIDAASATTDAAILGEAQAELMRQRTRTVLTGSLVNGPGAVYGKDWTFGDSLLAEMDGVQYLVKVEALAVTMQGGEETVTVSLKGEPA